MNILVGITGATGSIYGVKLMEALSKIENLNINLIISHWGRENIEIETDYKIDYIESLAHEVFDNNNLGGKTSSGSFKCDGMIILPCSMKTLSSIANGYSDNLISRSGDVMIKEGRKLVISPRETPLSPIHLENMLKLSRLGVKIVPPMPGFYNKPVSIEDIVNHHIMKILDQFGLEFDKGKRWNG